MGRITPIAALAGLTLALAQPLAAAPPTPPAAPAAVATPTAAAGEQDQPLPSRYQLGSIDDYITARAGSFSIAAWENDPFGLPQDPSKKPITPKLTPKVYNQFKNIPPTPFVDVVSALPVTAVMPNQQRFLIGSTTKRRGDRFPINYQDKSVTVEVVSVGGSRILFKNTSTGELATLTLALLPPGMDRESGSGARPPGLRRDNPSAPVQIKLPANNSPPTGAPRVTSAKR